jgi:hypothetical protein
MATIKDDDVIGYLIDEEHVCKECATQEEERSATLDETITVNNADGDTRYFCGRCKERM